MKHMKLIAIAALILLTGGLAAGWQTTAEEKAGTRSMLITNVDWLGRETDFSERPAPKKIFDVSIAAYSPHYAKLFGAEEDSRIMEMPKGLQAVELRVQTIGQKIQCQYRFLIDSDLNIDFPNHPVLAGRGALDVKLPLFNGYGSSENQMYNSVKDQIIQFGYYNRNIYLASINYDPKVHEHPQIMRNPSLDLYVPNFWPKMDLFQMSLGPECLPAVHQLKNTALWIKKKGGRDYTKTIHLQPEDFIKLTFPQKFQREAYELLKLIPQPNSSHN